MIAQRQGARPDAGDAHVVPIEPRQLGLGEMYHLTRDAVVVAHAAAGRIVAWNAAAAALFGYSEHEALGLLVENLVPSSLRTRHRAGLARFARDGSGELIDTGSLVEMPAVRKDGSELWVEMSLTPLTRPGLEGRYAMAIVRDVTERKAAEDALRREHALLEGSQALARVGSWVWDVSRGLGAGVEWSPEMYRIHGVDPDSFVLSRDSIEALVHPDDLEEWTSRLSVAAEQRQDLDGFTYRAVRPDGSLAWIWNEGRFEPESAVLTGFVQDVTDQKEAADELARLALVDDLTGLRNRRGFLVVAEPLLSVANRERMDVVLLYIDLDNMKSINDEHGHAAGDRALVDLASILRDTFRESDVIARLGGDEFCVMLHGSDGDAAIGRLNAALRARTAAPPISVSVGACVHRWQDPSSIDELLEQADAAMYEAKARKRSN